MAKKPTGGWPAPAAPFATVKLKLDGHASADETTTNLSAGTRVGNTLFVAGDENLAIDRLIAGARGWRGHRRFELSDLLELDAPDEEVDIEGLAEADGWLWVLGSHARTRPKPKKREDKCIDLAELADLKDTRPRCLLARLPLIEEGGALTPVAKDGKRRAGMVKQGKRGNQLMKLLCADPLIAPFTHIPAKEGGLDIEGIAIAGDRLALGLRGPTICGNALMLETRVHASAKGKLKLEPPFKRLLALEGLAIRDLKRAGADLLILAGPSTAVSGPCALYRWRDWASDPAVDVDQVRLHRPERLFDLPFGRDGDHPEGLALWEDDGVLVIYDSPANARLSRDGHTVTANLFRLPV